MQFIPIDFKNIYQRTSLKSNWERRGISNLHQNLVVNSMYSLESIEIKNGGPTMSNKIVIVLVFVSFFMTGCAMVQLKREVRESMSSTIIVGRVSAQSPINGPIVVAAYSKHLGKREIAHYTILHDCGEFELMVGKGQYYVFAYSDKNSNLIYDAGEPAGQYGEPKVVAAPAGGVVPNIDIVIPGSIRPIDWRTGHQIAPDRPQKLYSRLAGAIMDLNDECFLEEHGRQGYWEPVSFFKALGGNIYFLEEYDPLKIPILFIHGAGGTPKGWKYFVNNIDRTRFQPWFFYYPTGARMRSMSHLLLWKLINLQIKYQFDTIYITAHSMGGLVARSFIMDYGTGFPFVKLFISLATPWGGNKMAEYGVEQSPAVIPCWIDLQPDGDFIQSLYRAKMPETVNFYMFYGYRGSRNPFRSNNDGTLTLSSLLDRRSQAEAKMNYAFDEDHASIIYSKEVLEQYNTIINSFYAKHRASRHPSGGFIKLNFSYNYPTDGARPWPRLILRALGRKQTETEIALRPEDSGRVLGPFPCGNYSARIFAEAVKPQKKWVSLSIVSQSTNELNFVFTPDGTISGYITTAMKPQNRAVGMPGWEYVPKDNVITLQSITLTGAGTHRTLYPLEDKDDNWRDRETSRLDYCYKGILRFFGLPAGTYELVIHAKGHETYVKKHLVIPGTESAFEFYELIPEK